MVSMLYPMGYWGVSLELGHIAKFFHVYLGKLSLIFLFIDYYVSYFNKIAETTNLDEYLSAKKNLFLFL